MVRAVRSLPAWVKVTIPVLMAAAGSLGAFATAGAATSLPPGTFHGCVEYHHNRVLDNVYTDPANHPYCPKGSFMAVWNSKGPQGPAGPPGLAGVQADEPYGNNVDPNPHLNQSDSTVPAGKTAVIWAACPAGKVALGGGFRIGSGVLASESDSTPDTTTPGSEQVLASEPSFYDPATGKLHLAAAPIVNPVVGSYQPNAWAVTVYNSGTSDASARVSVVCAAESS